MINKPKFPIDKFNSLIPGYQEPNFPNNNKDNIFSVFSKNFFEYAK